MNCIFFYKGWSSLFSTGTESNQIFLKTFNLYEKYPQFDFSLVLKKTPIKQFYMSPYISTGIGMYFASRGVYVYYSDTSLNGGCFAYRITFAQCMPCLQQYSLQFITDFSLSPFPFPFKRFHHPIHFSSTGWLISLSFNSQPLH